MKYATLLLVATLFFQCTDQQEQTNDKVSAETTVEVTTTAAAPAVPTYPSISAEEMNYLWEKCDYVDFVFHGTNFAMSQNTQAAIRSTLSGVSTEIAVVDPTCQPMGRIFFQVDGVNQEEADIFLGQNCIYYLFLENGTYAYANKMTSSGIDFYQKIFTQVTTQQGG